MTDKCAKRRRLKRDSKDYSVCYKRCESCVVEERSDANDKKTSFGIPYPINNPPIRAGMQKKKCSSKLHSGQKTLKNVSHFFLYFCELQFKLSFDKNFGVLNHRNFFSIFSHCVKSTHLMLLQEWKKLCTLCEWEGFLKTLYISFYNLGTWQFAFIRAHRTIDVQSENKETIKVKYLVVQVVNSGKSLITVVTHL